MKDEQEKTEPSYSSFILHPSSFRSPSSFILFLLQASFRYVIRVVPLVAACVTWKVPPPLWNFWACSLKVLVAEMVTMASHPVDAWKNELASQKTKARVSETSAASVSFQRRTLTPLPTLEGETTRVALKRTRYVPASSVRTGPLARVVQVRAVMVSTAVMTAWPLARAGGACQVPSARRYLLVPPPLAGTVPRALVVKSLTVRVRSALKSPPPARGAVVATRRVVGTPPPPPPPPAWLKTSASLALLLMVVPLPETLVTGSRNQVVLSVGALLSVCRTQFAELSLSWIYRPSPAWSVRRKAAESVPGSVVVDRAS